MNGLSQSYNPDKKIGFICSGAPAFSLLPTVSLLISRGVPATIFTDEDIPTILRDIWPDPNLLDKAIVKNIDEIPDTDCRALVFTMPSFVDKDNAVGNGMIGRGVNLIYFPYGTEFMGHGYDAWIINRPYVEKCSLIFASSPQASAHYRRHKGEMPNLFCVGNPELDILYSDLYKDGRVYREMRDFVNRKYTFLYTPHWAVHKNPYWSSLFAFGESIYNFFQKNPQIRLICRPHPFLFKSAEQMSLETRLRVFKILDELRSLPNVFIDDAPSSLPAIGASDCLISDCSSIIQKFWLTGKPIIVSKIHYGAAHTAIETCLDMVASSDALLSAIQKHAGGIDPKAEKRRNWASFFSGPFDGKCSARMADILMSYCKIKEG